MDKLPKRKQYRLPNFDYSSNGAYFITICTKNKEHILSNISVGTTNGRPPEIILKETGKIVDGAIAQIPTHYEGVFIDNYVIMPNHIHMIIRIERDNSRAMLPPTVSRIIQQMKGYVTKKAGFSVWQDKSYDHIIRDDYDYMTRYQYIDDNPAKWLIKEDEYS